MKIADAGTVYLSGRTGLFSYMSEVNRVYKPNVVILSIGPNSLAHEEAAFASTFYFTHSESLFTISDTVNDSNQF